LEFRRVLFRSSIQRFAIISRISAKQKSRHIGAMSRQRRIVSNSSRPRLSHTCGDALELAQFLSVTRRSGSTVTKIEEMQTSSFVTNIRISNRSASIDQRITFQESYSRRLPARSSIFLDNIRATSRRS